MNKDLKLLCLGPTNIYKEISNTYNYPISHRTDSFKKLHYNTKCSLKNY